MLLRCSGAQPRDKAIDIGAERIGHVMNFIGCNSDLFDDGIAGSGFFIELGDQVYDLNISRCGAPGAVGDAASCLTSPATMAKPRPASPARAASIVVLSASRLVRFVISLIRLTTSPIRSAASDTPDTDAFAYSAALAPCCERDAASAAAVSISPMLVAICSDPATIPSKC